jgi:hypothetical protein
MTGPESGESLNLNPTKGKNMTQGEIHAQFAGAVALLARFSHAPTTTTSQNDQIEDVLQAFCECFPSTFTYRGNVNHGFCLELANNPKSKPKRRRLINQDKDDFQNLKSLAKLIPDPKEIMDMVE